MLTGTLITIAGFLPIGLARSNAGEYTFSIFAMVGIALISSWIVVVLFTPYLAYALLPKREPLADETPARPKTRPDPSRAWKSLTDAAGLATLYIMCIPSSPNPSEPDGIQPQPADPALKT